MLDMEIFKPLESFVGGAGMNELQHASHTENEVSLGACSSLIVSVVVRALGIVCKLARRLAFFFGGSFT
jgi:hypothetical protein